MFEIEFVPAASLLRWKFVGFWTETIAETFRKAIRAEMERVRGRHARFACLCDTRAFPVQSEPVMRKLAEMTQDMANGGSRKFAILVSTALNTLQAERFFGSDRIRVFRDEEKALAWLAEPAGDARRAA